MSEKQIRIPKRILGTLLNSASAGVVARQGLEYLAIGREKEIQALQRDLDNIALGMGAFRFLVGRYGSGKSFLMGLIRNYAHERGFVTADCDLSPERRFHGTQGQGLATFRELILNLSCQSMPDKNALPVILGNWFTKLQSLGITQEGFSPDSQELSEYVKKNVFRVSEELQSGINGFDFARVLCEYYRAYTEHDDELSEDCLRWLRGEFATKLQLRASRIQSVNAIIDDRNWYDYLKLYAIFFRRIGYSGFCVFFDECVNLYKIPNRISRENNFEKILSMFNDTMQGKAEGIGFFLGATPQLIEDPRRGLYSYEALQSRLIPGKFTVPGRQNLLSPLIYLSRLTDNEIFALCRRLLVLHTSYYAYTARINDDDVIDFLKISLKRMGADEMITPREITRDFLNILDLMYSDPQLSFSELIGKSIASEQPKTDSFDDFFDENAFEL